MITRIEITVQDGRLAYSVDGHGEVCILDTMLIESVEAYTQIANQSPEAVQSIAEFWEKREAGEGPITVVDATGLPIGDAITLLADMYQLDAIEKEGE